MASLEARNSDFNQETWDQLRKLCCKPSDPAGVISDEQFESIAACLRCLENHDASYRPRTYAILHMNRVDLLISFVVAGLLDNSLPYPDRKSLPPLMRGEHDACSLFLELQTHVTSAACHKEKGLNSKHMLVESGDNFLDTLGRLGKGGEAKVDRRDLNGGKRILKEFENELQILRKLDHTHLVKVFASYTDKKYLAILMKPIADQDLKRYLLDYGGKPLIGSERERFRTYYGCLTSAVAYLHENNIRHKDIKPNNIVLKRDEIYITDFGTAIEFDDDKSVTKGTVKARTVGVTFLEMTTVLRGQSLDDMQTFLTQHGTGENIKQAADGMFCNKCCHSDGSFESDTSSDCENSDFEKDDKTIRPAFISTPDSNNDNKPQTGHPSGEGLSTLEIAVDPVKGSSIPAADESLPGTETQRSNTHSPVALSTPPSTVQEDAAMVRVTSFIPPARMQLTGAFPEFASSESLSHCLLSEPVDARQGVERAIEFVNDQPIEFESSPDTIPELDTSLNVSSASLPAEHNQGSFKCYASPSCVLFEESTTLSRTRSDESLQIQQKTNALLSDVEAYGEDAPTHSRSRRFSLERRHGIVSYVASEFDIDKVRKWKSELDDLVNATYPPISPPILNDMTPETRHSLRSKTKRAKSEKSTTSFSNQKSRVDEPKAFLDPDHSEEIVEEMRSTSKLTKRPAVDLSSSPKIVLVSRPKTNPLKGWFSQARSPSEAYKPTAHTSENLYFLNSQTSSRKQKAHPTFKIKSASVYMKQVYNDAASSVATSVMSTNTRKSMKLYGLMLPLQDRSSNFLERYTKAGKADVVRMLLREGCTVKKPRPAPIFHTVRGASSRHTKCLRALIQHKVDTNVRARSTRKTPLIEAIEQEAWSGYVNVIFLLLAAGANPNAKDGAGDVALLKVLGAGQKPLEENRHAALALLLSTAYDTNMNVTPLGTGNNPLHLAIRRVDPWALGMLLEKDSTLIEAKNSEGLTPLSLACSAWTSTITPGQLEILDVLLEKKANVNVNITARAKTPLHTAVSLGLVDAVERLLKNGADPLKRTRDGETARDMAKERRKQHG
ncbi:hypothetical protein HYALB_00006773, partial [Hymenoscyphus albidus]